MRLTRLLHASFLVADIARARAFYEGILGLVPSPKRPVLVFAGVWYEFGPQQLHLIESREIEMGKQTYPGRDRHVAFGVDDLELLKLALEAARIDFTASSSGRPAIFLRDPDGNALEVIEERRV